MSMVDEMFNRALNLGEGKKMVIECRDVKQVNSVRTMIYRQVKKFKKDWKQDVEFSCVRVGNTLVLERRTAMVFKIVDEDGEVCEEGRVESDVMPEAKKKEKNPFDIKVGGPE